MSKKQFQEYNDKGDAAVRNQAVLAFDNAVKHPESPGDVETAARGIALSGPGDIASSNPAQQAMFRGLLLKRFAAAQQLESSNAPQDTDLGKAVSKFSESSAAIHPGDRNTFTDDERNTFTSDLYTSLFASGGRFEGFVGKGIDVVSPEDGGPLQVTIHNAAHGDMKPLPTKDQYEVAMMLVEVAGQNDHNGQHSGEVWW